MGVGWRSQNILGTPGPRPLAWERGWPLETRSFSHMLPHQFWSLYLQAYARIWGPKCWVHCGPIHLKWGRAWPIDTRSSATFVILANVVVLGQLVITECGCPALTGTVITECGCLGSTGTVITECGCPGSTGMVITECGCPGSTGTVITECGCSGSTGMVITECGCPGSTGTVITEIRQKNRLLAFVVTSRSSEPTRIDQLFMTSR